MQPLSVLLQESDDDFRNEITTELSSVGAFLLRHSYKSFELLMREFFYRLPDVIIFSWHYPQQICFDFITRALAVQPQLSIIITFDFVQPDFVFQLQQLGVKQCLVKPFLIGDILKYNQHVVISNKFSFHLNQLQAKSKAVYVKEH